MTTWWQDATVYQVWPASFKDSNADGIGDIRGVVDSLDYLHFLGIDVIWLCPVYASPWIDFGYDISDYEAVRPQFGTLQDVQDLIDGCHARGMRLLMDLVVNHTSDQHVWFQESRSSRSNPKRNWYIWRPPRFDKKGKRCPPNNWRSNFSGSAWTWDETTQQYYLHLFAKEQPDLNWECHELRQAVYESALRFWLRRGIDGFRIDTMAIYAKNPRLPDAPITDPSSPWQTGRDFYAHQPEVFHILSEMNQVLREFGPNKMTVGEFGHLDDTASALRYVGASQERVSMGFQFETVCLGYALNHWNIRPFALSEFKAVYEKWERFIEGTDGWTCGFLENHDVARSVSRFGNDSSAEYRQASAKMLAMLLATTTGTLFLYQGQEIGMTNMPKAWGIDEYQDISSQNYWASVQGEKEGGGDPNVLQKSMAKLQAVARDHARTPMQWNTQPFAGFTTAKQGPWMRVNDNYHEINVQQQRTDPDSVLSFWRTLLALRKQYRDLFVHGRWETLNPSDESVMAYLKTAGANKALIVLNFTSSPQPVAPSVPSVFVGLRPILVNVPKWDAQSLGAYEARLYVYEPAHRSNI